MKSTKPTKPTKPTSLDKTPELIDMYKAAYAQLVAEILMSTFTDVVKERLDPSEWQYLDINTVACILDQLNCGE